MMCKKNLRGKCSQDIGWYKTSYDWQNIAWRGDN